MHVQARQFLEARRQFRRKRRGAGAAIANAGDVGIDGDVGQRGQYGRHRRHHRGAVFFGQAPVVGDHGAVAHQAGCWNHGFCAGGKRRQCAGQRAGNVKQRKHIDRHVFARHALHLHAGPGGEHLRAVAVARQLGRAGRAAGVEVGSDVALGDGAARYQAVIGLRRTQDAEVTRFRRLVKRRHAQ